MILTARPSSAESIIKTFAAGDHPVAFELVLGYLVM